jgi:L-ascorbate metabolism protein UlaG (beta-lactamase superfamily)
VPIHFNTFPVIEQDPQAFVDSLKNTEGIAMKAGDELEL